ncbi:DurN family substrate-assisted peptide maturase [Actinomadura oligospora]|uniref:DurN family substrate-assisted peptide maturase n=1 Tax=Actinomadura oligospora TaxID=111804 RepID=UPI0004B6DC30|nr:DurN family substrate-assisted peptide maturase [Actinomadura oligospora]
MWSTGPKPPSDVTKHKNIYTVRQIQHLLVLCSLLKQDGPLARTLANALALDPLPMAVRAEPVPSVHPQATKDWLESFWEPAALTPDEVEVAAWQNNITEMVTAVEEIHAIEKLIGIRLTTEIMTQPEENSQ